MSTIDCDIQHETDFTPLPSDESILSYANIALEGMTCSLTIRFVDEPEIQALNLQYRQKDKPTNVLSFPFLMPDLPDCDLNLLGDVIICLNIVKQEAQDQGKSFENHLAHMVIHGILHLLGYDHIEEEEANVMEAKEIAFLKKLNIANPYQNEA